MPIEIGLYFSFIILATIAILSPGPDTLIIVRYTLGSGYKVGLAATIGVQIGLVLHGIFAVLGLSIIIEKIPIALQIITVLGALYLLILAAQEVKNIFNKKSTNNLSPSNSGIYYRNAAVSAILTNILNPKVILLFIAIMPGFIDLDKGPIYSQFAIFAATMIFINSVFQVSIIFLADYFRKFLIQPQVQKFLSIITALIFVIFAVIIALDHF
ncbi:MAG: hypothetical protein CL567_04435 [Alphaproteobacteria bacterium]|nr:hypothetical protein [Alphaproteobacteria bacterium]|tara:strand:- start:184 stop:822 length:639 start_codon:yes stop_codon:yes gene_type:complete